MEYSTDDAFIAYIANRLASVSGVRAVALGGSRATGEHRSGSDYDFAVYYRGTFEPDGIRRLGWPGTVFGTGEWGGGVMNGGAWLTADGRRVDVHYRDLDEVERHLQAAEKGRFQVERLPFYLAGIPTYVVAAELALGRTLTGSLPKPEYPELLREEACRFWHDSALLHLSYAEEAYAANGDPVGTAGTLARAIIEESHARLAARGEWVLNEKRIAARAGLGHLAAKFIDLSRDPSKLIAAVRDVREQFTACPD
ncbi:nucleotidyltransferase domain-containing protein [Paenibacillus humicola]|uniref:nucleotidyltransferase domain-containing protein n=1 Tax=Paenibacillus humicola TaxID=3110540 RepID=UPI00237AB725|nr:nucleotidyltransferase domain-containing protein [Paenibacillus humicola]